MKFDNISREDILKALKQIDVEGVPNNRKSTKYYLTYEGNFYPPKYVLTLANKYANGKELPADEFYGGEETNSILINLGFEIRNGAVPVVAYKKDGSNKPFKNDGSFIVVTALIESNGNFSNQTRLKQLNELLEDLDENDLLILPGGFLNFTKLTKQELEDVETRVQDMLKQQKKKILVCFGIDAAQGKDQFGLAISPEGIIGIGRKFYPAPGEENFINQAESIQEKEFGFERTFDWQGKKCFLAVCYDGFGIKHRKIPNYGISMVIDLIHSFYPKGEGGSGEVYFAKHGLAGAAKQWKCPSFGAAVFFNRPIPSNWQSGIIWNKGDMSTQLWKYDDNPLRYKKQETIKGKNETIELRYFDVGNQ